MEWQNIKVKHADQEGRKKHNKLAKGEMIRSPGTKPWTNDLYDPQCTVIICMIRVIRNDPYDL